MAEFFFRINVSYQTCKGADKPGISAQSHEISRRGNEDNMMSVVNTPDRPWRTDVEKGFVWGNIKGALKFFEKIQVFLNLFIKPKTNRFWNKNHENLQIFLIDW